MQDDCVYTHDASTLTQWSLELKALANLDQFLIYYQFVTSYVPL